MRGGGYAKGDEASQEGVGRLGSDRPRPAPTPRRHLYSIPARREPLTVHEYSGSPVDGALIRGGVDLRQTPADVRRRKLRRASGPSGWKARTQFARESIREGGRGCRFLQRLHLAERTGLKAVRVASRVQTWGLRQRDSRRDGTSFPAARCSRPLAAITSPTSLAIAATPSHLAEGVCSGALRGDSRVREGRHLSLSAFARVAARLFARLRSVGVSFVRLRFHAITLAWKGTKCCHRFASEKFAENIS